MVRSRGRPWSTLLACLLLVPGVASALCADGDHDGQVVATDARLALVAAVAGVYRAELDVEFEARIDGRVSATDALVILQHALSGRPLPCAAFTTERAAVVTASNSFASGSVTEMTVRDRATTPQPVVLAGDSVARVQGGRLFVLNRFLANNVQELDPGAGYATVKQCGLGAGKNPVDFLMLAPDKAYVSQYDSPVLAIVDPSVAPDCTGFVRGGIDLSAWADADGIPEMDQMVRVGDRVFLVLQLLDRTALFRPSGPGLLLVIDQTTDSVVQTLVLALANPFARTKGLPYDAISGRIYVGGPGTFFSDPDDGGIEAIDPVTLTSDGLLVDGTQLGGDLTDFVMTGATRGYAVVSETSGANRLVAFDAQAGGVTETLAVSQETFSDIEAAELGELWLADRSFAGGATGGIRIFSLLDGAELTPAPLPTGLLPFDLVFF